MLSALDLARRIDAGELTPRKVIDLCAEAIAAREPEIGAFVQLDLETARLRAAAPGLAQSPLAGLPVGVKDIFDTADFPTEYGTPIYSGHRPKADASIVALTRRAGGIVLGKTVTTEFATMQPAGTRNPRNPGHTPGGSSSGSAASVAAGMVPIAFGTQTAGSVIRPASFCGVAALKPSFRLIPTIGVKCVAWSLDTVGLFAASVADVAFATAAITGRDLRVDREAPAPPSIAIARTHIWSRASDMEASADMQAAVEQAAYAAESAGAKLRDLELPPLFEEALAAQFTIQDFEAFRSLAWEFDHHRERLSPVLRAQLEKAASIDFDTYDEARRIARRARQMLANLLADNEVILTPSAPGVAPEGLDTTGNPIFNRLWSVLGAPCVNVPGIVDASGLPLGVQVVGRFARDQGTLAAACFLERVLAAAEEKPA